MYLLVLTREGKTRRTKGGKAAGRKEKGKQRSMLRFHHWGFCCPHPTSEWHAISKKALSGKETTAAAGQKQDQSHWWRPRHAVAGINSPKEKNLRTVERVQSAWCLTMPEPLFWVLHQRSCKKSKSRNRHALAELPIFLTEENKAWEIAQWQWWWPGPQERREPEASPVARWWRVRLPTQGTWVRSLVREDPPRPGATKPMHDDD